MTKNSKRTKKENLMTLREIIETTVNDRPDVDELLEFIDKEIAALNKKAEDAKKRAAKTKAAGDELKEKILATLTTEEFKTTPEIIKMLDDESLSSQKVTARLTQLIDAGLAEKETVKRPNPANPDTTIKKVGYRRIEKYLEALEVEEEE